MSKRATHLNSFEIYTKYRPGTVIQVDRLSDVNSGMNPCYYMRDENGLRVSSSVASLILESGSFHVDPAFKPPKFFLHPWQRDTVEAVRDFVSAAESRVRRLPLLRGSLVKKIKSMAPHEVKTFFWDPHYSAHISCDSIDVRIKKLRPFETVSATERAIVLEPDFALNSIDEYLERSAALLRKSVNDVEAAYPAKKHIVLMGGKDSQLISVIPKLNDENWYIFSAEPNYALIKDWVAENKIHATRIFAHDGLNEERFSDFKRKVMCSDLYTNLIHVRYLPTLEKLVSELGGDCMFWLGSMPRRASLYDASYRKPEAPMSRSQFFNVHMNTFPGWQGNIQQTYSNYLGCPFFSPYYLKDMWFELYSHLDPDVLIPGSDYRATLAEILAGRKLSWPASNPGPAPYAYWYFWFSSYGYYTRYVEKQLCERRI